MRALVTGGCGFIGSHLCYELLTHGHTVYVVDRAVGPTHAGCHRVGNGPLSLQEFADTDWPSLITHVFHLAAFSRVNPSLNNPMDAYESNSLGTIHVLEAIRRKNPGCHLIYAGTSIVGADPNANPYSYTKGLGEQHCRFYHSFYGVKVAIARFYNVYGPGAQRTGQDASVVGIFEGQYQARADLTVTGDGSQTRDFVHVKDVCAGLRVLGDAMQKGLIAVDGKTTYNFGTGCPRSIKSVAEMFQTASMNVKHIPARAGELRDSVADISAALRLGWVPDRKSVV